MALPALAGILLPELIKVIGTMPMETLAAFEGMALSHTELNELIAEL